MTSCGCLGDFCVTHLILALYRSLNKCLFSDEISMVLNCSLVHTYPSIPLGGVKGNLPRFFIDVPVEHLKETHKMYTLHSAMVRKTTERLNELKDA